MHQNWELVGTWLKNSKETVFTFTFTIVLDLFSSTCRNKFLFLWCSLGSTRLGASLTASKTSWVFKKLDDGHDSMVTVNFRGTVFSLVDFLTLEHGTNRVCHNISTELPLNTA